MSTIIWEDCESGEPVKVAYLNGILGEYEYDKEDRKWFWLVKASGKRSEYPEVWSSGTTKTALNARQQAEKAMVAADASYGHPFENA